ncbi:uncharacterized protein TNCV_160571 [Trichonephila clavipes]|nr:uncharacterized protein TNCV_160571 [Trichonephila clavipes]
MPSIGGYHSYGLASIVTGLESNRACWPTNYSPSTLSHLSTGFLEALLDEWCNIPQDQIDNLILSMPTRCEQEFGGRITWYTKNFNFFTRKFGRVLVCEFRLLLHKVPGVSKVTHIPMKYPSETMLNASTVTHLVQRFHDTGSVAGRKRSNRASIVETKVGVVETVLQRSPMK